MEYKTENGSDFKHLTCVPILHQMPKFDPTFTGPIDVEDDPDLEETAEVKKHNHIGSVQGQNHPKPTGQKAAKLQRLKDLQSVASTETTKLETLSSIANSNEIIAKAALAKQRHSTWMSIANMYKASGDDANCAVYLQKVIADQDAMEKERTKGTSKRVPVEVSVATHAPTTATVAAVLESSGPPMNTAAGPDGTIIDLDTGFRVEQQAEPRTNADDDEDEETDSDDDVSIKTGDPSHDSDSAANLMGHDARKVHDTLLTENSEYSELDAYMARQKKDDAKKKKKKGKKKQQQEEEDDTNDE